MADCSQFLVNYWAGEKIFDIRYIDLIENSQQEPEDVDADEIVERIVSGLQKLGE